MTSPRFDPRLRHAATLEDLADTLRESGTGLDHSSRDMLRKAATAFSTRASQLRRRVAREQEWASRFGGDEGLF